MSDTASPPPEVLPLIEDIYIDRRVDAFGNPRISVLVRRPEDGGNTDTLCNENFVMSRGCLDRLRASLAK